MITRRAPLRRNTKPIARSTTPIARSALKRHKAPRQRSGLGRGLANGKSGKTPKALRAARRRAEDRLARDAKADVWIRQSGLCIARDVSPVCQGVMHDPHEVIPRSQGGDRTDTRNIVGICRRDHREAQGRVGGNRLLFDWPGKAEGKPPNADEPGNVTARWRDL